MSTNANEGEPMITEVAKKPKKPPQFAQWSSVGTIRKQQCDECLRIAVETYDPGPPPRLPAIAAAQHKRVDVDGTDQILCPKHARPLMERDERAKDKAKREKKQKRVKR